jgi:two-component system cell cycle response regulator DivK
MPTATSAGPILIVDDEPDTVRYLEMVLHDNGYRTVTASDGEAALAAARREKPLLVTLDVSMPKASGTRFYRAMKEDAGLASVPIVIVTGVTGYGGDPYAYKAFLDGRSTPPPDAYFPKPIDRDGFLAAVKRLTPASFPPKPVGAQ